MTDVVVTTCDRLPLLKKTLQHIWERTTSPYADKLLVLDICAGEGYEQLCPFLNRSLIDEPFPHRNARRNP